MPDGGANAPLRRVLAGLTLLRVPLAADLTADVDTPADAAAPASTRPLPRPDPAIHSADPFRPPGSTWSHGTRAVPRRNGAAGRPWARPPLDMGSRWAAMMQFNAIILAGGRAARLGGIDKCGIEIGGRRLLDAALAATDGPRRA